MNIVLVGILLLINVAIATWNCYAVGVTWKDVQALGTKFDKVVIWSAIVQSAIGFSMPILLALSYLGFAIATGGSEPYMSPAEGAAMLEVIYSLWYVLVILPILTTGFALWAHSIRVAFMRRDFGSIAAAGWNTFAQISNTVSAVNNLGGALGNVGSLFSGVAKSDSNIKVKGGILIFLAVVVSIALGFWIAFALVRHFANATESRIERHGVDLKKRMAA